MTDVLPTAEIATQNPENKAEVTSLIENSSAVRKARNRVNAGKSPRIFSLDVDGTLYHKEKTDQGTWVNTGDNTELSNHIKENDETTILNTGVPNWEPKDDKRMQDINLDPNNVDVVVTGGGTVVQWRDGNGVLQNDLEWQQRIINHQIRFIRDGKSVEQNYSASTVQELVNDLLTQQRADESSDFSTSAITETKIDPNPNGGYTTLVVDNMSPKDFEKLADMIRGTVAGVKVQFTERLDIDENGQLNGWALLVPSIAGKHGSSRYVFESIADAVTTGASENTQQKLDVHIMGDASVDVGMLALGAGKRDKYNVTQYALGNVTSYAESKLSPVIKALRWDEEMQQFYNEAVRSEGGLEIRRAELRSNLTAAQESDDTSKEEAAREDLRTLSRGEQIDKGWRAANVQIIDQQGSEGVRSVLATLK